MWILIEHDETTLATFNHSSSRVDFCRSMRSLREAEVSANQSSQVMGADDIRED